MSGGAFTIRLVLDRGAAEYVLRPSATDAEVLVRLLRRNRGPMFDLERKVVVFLRSARTRDDAGTASGRARDHGPAAPSTLRDGCEE